VSVTGLVSPFGLLALHEKIVVPGGCWMTSPMFVNVSVGLTPVQFGFGHPAVVPGTVAAAVKVAGLVVNVRLPFLIALAGMLVLEVAGPTNTLFCPGATLPPPFEHW
jgi:hypothetical protein